jgi:hypothetical protein
MSTLTITFTPPATAPANGYIVQYRQVGTTPYTTVSPNPTASPVVITGVDGSESWEGLIQADCGSGFSSDALPFTANAIICEAPSGVSAALS